ISRKSSRYVFFFFFFQAEDGIRDFHVTGVQTCALPICRAVPRAQHLDSLPATRSADAQRSGGRGSQQRTNLTERCRSGRSELMRSEERRVGKECRSRWWPCH